MIINDYFWPFKGNSHLHLKKTGMTIKILEKIIMKEEWNTKIIIKIIKQHSGHQNSKFWLKSNMHLLLNPLKKGRIITLMLILSKVTLVTTECLSVYEARAKRYQLIYLMISFQCQDYQTLPDRHSSLKTMVSLHILDKRKTV